MKSSAILLLLVEIFLVQHVAVLSVQRDFDFFYFVQQWPGSHQDTVQGCSSKPGKSNQILVLTGCGQTTLMALTLPTITDIEKKLQKNWPVLDCLNNDGLKFWGHEWDKHGTCSESILDQEEYFEKALKLKKKIKLLHILHKEGIKPDGGFYSSYQIKKAIEDEIEVTPFISCNDDESGNSHPSKVYVCVDKFAKKFIHCPVLPKGSCSSSKIYFPRFGHIDTVETGEDALDV
ncbi:hypothetical protein MKW98_009304 [Papaver atlanticum]|uniref:Uncharacterized protein n=1 Tax=Papaver atlanticum TaxID=357466 RepID=A0AAD4SDR0_9MAGN|nr:hypothetical protein MKW98_009304 [Papaver atlanticum]